MTVQYSKPGRGYIVVTTNSSIAAGPFKELWRAAKYAPNATPGDGVKVQDWRLAKQAASIRI